MGNDVVQDLKDPHMGNNIILNLGSRSLYIPARAQHVINKTWPQKLIKRHQFKTWPQRLIIDFWGPRFELVPFY